MAAPGQSNQRFDEQLSELDAAISALQRRYELYFLGLDRREPAQDRDALKKRLMALKRASVRNTALKFRLNSLWNKFLSYERMWQRTVTEIEEGRYRRDVFKAKMRAKRRAELEALEEAQRKGLAAADALEAAAKGEAAGEGPPQAAKKARARAAQAKKGSGGGAISDEKLEKLYRAFVTAKKRCKEDTSGLSLEAMRRSLDRQIPKIKAKHGAKSVDFKVVIKGGKAILKAVPRS